MWLLRHAFCDWYAVLIFIVDSDYWLWAIVVDTDADFLGTPTLVGLVLFFTLGGSLFVDRVVVVPSMLLVRFSVMIVVLCLCALLVGCFLSGGLWLVIGVLFLMGAAGIGWFYRRWLRGAVSSESAFVLGETLSGHPFALPRHIIQRNHLCLVGESGTGKSVTAARILTQCAAAGEPIIVIDPKDDRYLARALYQAAQDHGCPMQVIDCRPTAPPQINPFADLSSSDLRQCLIAAWGIQDTGNAAVNYYRAQDREAAALAADMVVRSSLCFPDFLAQAARVKAIYRADHFWRLCREIGTMPVVQTAEGWPWSRLLLPGHILYVISSTEDEKVQILTKLILQRIVQTLRARPLSDATPDAAIFIDELRYMLSEVTLNSLSTIRDRRVHLLLAFQDVNNLLENPMLNPHAVQSIVTANTGIKCVFRIQHVETADLFVKMSRTRSVLRKSYHQSAQGRSMSFHETLTTQVTREELMRLPKPAFDGDWCHGYAFFDGQEQRFRNRPLPISATLPPVYEAMPYAGGICRMDQLI